MPAKGKRVLSRIVRFLTADQSILLVTILCAIFAQLDVIAHAPLLDALQPSEERAEVDRNTQVFLDVLHLVVVPIISRATLRQTYGLIGLLDHRTDVVAVAKTEVSDANLIISDLKLIRS